MKSSNSVHEVVIVGAGFGGLRAVKGLAHAPVHVTLIDRNNYHLFQPLLYQVATAGITPEEIAYPVRTIFRRQKNFTFRLAEVTGFDLENHSVQTTSGPVHYDTLVLAPGGQTNTFGIELVGAHSLGMKDLRDATSVRNHLLRQFEAASQEKDADRRRAMLTFVIAGGGPTGVETAGAIMELLQMALKHDRLGIRPEDVRVILMEGTGQLLAGMPADLGEAAYHMLAGKGVAVRFNALITGYDGERVRLKSGESLPAGTLIWAAGVRAVSLVSRLNLPLSRLGQAIVGPDLRVPGHPEVFVIGDAAAPTARRQAPADGCPSGDPAGGTDGCQHPAGPARRAAAAVCVPRPRHFGHDWAQPGGGARAGHSHHRLSGLAGLAGPAHRAADRFPQPAAGVDQLGLGLPVLRPGGPPDLTLGPCPQKPAG